MKKTIILGAMVILGVVTSLIAIELGFRVLVPYIPNSKIPRSDRPRIYFFSEKSKSTHDYSYDEAKPEGTFRIVVIGDSFAYGYGNLFDDAFPKRLERILNLNDKATKVEVINLSNPGFSTADEAKRVNKILKKWSPDLLMLEITLNDPEFKRFNPHEKRDKKGGIVLKGGIYDHWKSLAYVAGRIKNELSGYQTKRYYQDLWENKKNLANFTVAFRDIIDKVRSANVKFIAVIFPLLSFPLDDNYPFFHAHSIIQEYAKKFGAYSVDLYPNFANLDPYRLQAHPRLDPHPNEIAHRIAAEGIYFALVKHHLIPQDVKVRYMAHRRIGAVKLRKHKY
ncbi:MAG: hypothetical protein GYA55_12630 [SAR324 cluster bacterium]|uniref:SGNH hydrolase-type esterase domain-containing protein n=1 Tax=SAR324 cluster bacterium TaxID=2024889 RepID=A0A7X9FUA1_9DELT|nr:hypothetical protein [SAR324 cluster bacterium]